MGEANTVPGAHSHLTALRTMNPVGKLGQNPSSRRLVGLVQAPAITNRSSPIRGR